MNRSALLDPPLARSPWSREELQERFPEAQLPTYLTAPRYVATRGPAVAELCASIDFTPDAEQCMFLDLVFAVQDVESEMPAVTVLDLIAPRQNLKSATFEMCCLGWLYLDAVRVRRVVWSAHEEETARDAMKAMRELRIEPSWLMELQPKDRTLGFVSGNNATRIVTAVRDGLRSQVDFKTRTAGGGRGGKADKLIVDEAYALQPAHMAALSPILSTAAKGQRLYGSSAARPESNVLRGRVRIGRAEKGSPSSVYAEYCAPPAEVACDAGERCRHEYHEVGCALGKPEMISVANTAYGDGDEGDRISDVELDAQWQDMGSDAARERLSWHDEADAVELRPLRMDTWLDVRDPDSRRADGARIAFGVDESPDSAFLSFGIAGRRTDDRMHVEAIAAPDGRAPDLIVAFADKHKPIVTVIEGASPAAKYVPELLTRGFVRVSKVDDDVPKGAHRLLVLGSQDNARACGGFVADVRTLVVWHAGQPTLDSAVQGATGRALAGGVAWSRKDTSVNITPLQAVTNARHGLVVFGAAKVKRATWAALG